jgi:hypothetical protein
MSKAAEMKRNSPENHFSLWIGKMPVARKGNAMPSKTAAPKRTPKPLSLTMWVNHLSLLAGDPSVSTSFDAVSSGVGGGLSGLVIESTTTGDTGAGGGNKVVEKSLDLPPGFLVKGVRVGYENSNARSFITQVRLAQVQNPPASAVVMLDDAAHLNAAGPAFADSEATSIDPAAGPLLLSLRVNFADTSDKIVVRGLGLHLVRT